MIDDRCERCKALVALPEIAIICQNCYRFLVPVTLWHGLVAVIAILGAIVLHVRTGHSAIPLVVGLLTSQLLLLATVRLLDRRLVLFVLSLALIPVSISIVAVVNRFEDQLPPLLPRSLPWLVTLLFLGLAVQLFLRWWEIGRTRKLSVPRIISTFSVFFSFLTLLLTVVVSFIPDDGVPERGLWLTVQRAVQLRTSLFMVWLGCVVLLAISPAFDRPVDIPTYPSPSFLSALKHAAMLVAAKVANLVRELRGGVAEIVDIARVALRTVVRSFVFVASSVGLQVAFCLLIENYLGYMDTRSFSWSQLVVSAFLLVGMFAALFWSATAAAFADVFAAAIHTLTLVGLMLLLLASIASWGWFPYEIWSRRTVGLNWFALITIGCLLVAIITNVVREYEGDDKQRI